MQLIATTIDEDLCRALGFAREAIALDRRKLGRGFGAQLFGLLAIGLVACGAVVFGERRHREQTEG